MNEDLKEVQNAELDPLVLQSFKDLANILKTGKSGSVNNPNLGEIEIENGFFKGERLKSNGKPAKGEGLKHIIEERYGESLSEITAILALVTDSAKDGKYTTSDRDKLAGYCKLEKNGIIALLSKKRGDKASNTWLLTGFIKVDEKEAAAVAIKTVNAQYGYTPEFSLLRNQVGAVLASLNILSEKSLKSSSPRQGRDDDFPPEGGSPAPKPPSPAPAAPATNPSLEPQNAARNINQNSAAQTAERSKIMANEKQGFFARLKANLSPKTNQAAAEQELKNLHQTVQDFAATVDRYITVSGKKYESEDACNAALANGQIKLGDKNFFYKVEHDVDWYEYNDDGTKTGSVKYAYLNLSETPDFKQGKTLTLEGPKCPSVYNFEDTLFITQKHFENKTNVSLKDIEEYRPHNDYTKFIDNAVREKVPQPYLAVKEDVIQPVKIGNKDFFARIEYDWEEFSETERAVKYSTLYLTENADDKEGITIQGEKWKQNEDFTKPLFFAKKEFEKSNNVSLKDVQEYLNDLKTTTYYNASQIEGCEKYVAPEKSKTAAPPVPQVKCKDAKSQYTADMASYMTAVLSGKGFNPQPVNRDNNAIKALSGNDLKRMCFDAKNIASAALAPKKEMRQERAQERVNNRQAQSISM